ncbi:lasso peptide biosynthesis PqqD family chaperone [Neobacillus sp. BF23-41]|uniref:lasso peptide biosynthesis PqqD family chaperone n=1 Tax=Neobacillus sp. BF23-41 TaxID=3240280 RepID=UPI0034E59C81
MIKNKGISLNKIVVQVKGNIVSDMGGEKVMLSVKNGKYYNLGEIGGEIWDLIEEKIPVNQLISLLKSKYNVVQTECEEQVISFLYHLVEEGLIEISDN